jgi:hypothetical protein
VCVFNVPVRQEVVRHEKKCESLVRWVRIILRSLPLTFYMLPLPYLLVYKVFPAALHHGNESNITAYLVLYFAGVILLQVLGSFRAYYSWKTRDSSEKIPAAPSLYYAVPVEDAEDNVHTTFGLSTLLSTSGKGKIGSSKDDEYTTADDGIKYKQSQEHVTKQKTEIPLPPNTFKFTAAANIVELLSLSVEFLQMASFALQSSPYSVNNDDDGSSTAPVDDNDDEESSGFWGEKLFKIFYVHVPGARDVQYGCMWGSVGVVGLLVILFATQFLSELKKYGRLMVNPDDKDEAKDSFFFSFTGAIVYGHGKPNNISPKMRLFVAILSDALFLVVSFQLLKVFSCDYSNGENEAPVLRVDDTVTCWEGPHALLATIAMICYSYYVPLSVMITPMLLENPPPPEDTNTQLESDNDGSAVANKKSKAPAATSSGGVTYLKLYLMTLNVVKSVMLLVGVLGPETVTTAVMSSCIASFLLGSITLLWFGRNDITSGHYSSDMHPCNIAFINYWKGASYTAAVASALIILTAYQLKDTSFFPMRILTPVLIGTWVAIVVIFVVAYWRFAVGITTRRELIKDLIAYPFYFRDAYEHDKLFSDVGPLATQNTGVLWKQELKSEDGFDKVITSGPHGTPAGANDDGDGDGVCRNAFLIFTSSLVAPSKRHIPGFKVSPWADTHTLDNHQDVDMASAVGSVGTISGVSHTSSGHGGDRGQKNSLTWFMVDQYWKKQTNTGR